MDDEVRELDVYVDNEPKLAGQFNSIIRNVTRRLKNGTYDPALAPKLWQYWYDEAARRYKAEFGYQFSPAVRRACAAARAVEEAAKIQNGEYDG